MEGIFARDAAALAARSRCRHTAHVHTGGRRLHQRAAPRVAEEPHDRKRDQLEVQRADRLSGRGVDVVRPDGGNHHPGACVRTSGGGGEADRMSAVEAIPAARRRPKLGAALWALVRQHMLTVYSLVFFAYLLLPIGVVIAFSFNNPAGRFNYTWQGFTWDNWRNWDSVPGLRSAVGLSLEIALIASIVATALGTLIALALLAALLLCFAISIDDFVTTYFNAGSRVTFPLFVWGAARVATPPQINVIGTAIFVVAVGGMLANILFQNRRARRLGMA